MKANKSFRESARRAGVPLWRVAIALGVSEATLTRMLRVELPEEKTAQLLCIVDEIKEGGDF